MNEATTTYLKKIEVRGGIRIANFFFHLRNGMSVGLANDLGGLWGAPALRHCAIWLISSLHLSR